jgi:hypothetical protein
MSDDLLTRLYDAERLALTPSRSHPEGLTHYSVLLRAAAARIRELELKNHEQAEAMNRVLVKLAEAERKVLAEGEP